MKPRYYGAIAVFGIMLCIWGLALAQTGRSTKITISTPVTQTVAGDPVTGVVTYNYYQGAKGSTTKTKIGSSTILTFTATGLPAGETCFNATAQTAVNGESGLSPEACKSFPYDKPTGPTITLE